MSHIICDICNKKMLDGYVISDGIEYYCSDNCLYGAFTKKEYLNMFNNGYAYWTTFED